MQNFWFIVQLSFAIMAISSMIGVCALVFILCDSIKRTKLLERRNR